MAYTESEQLSLKMVLVTARMIDSLRKVSEQELKKYELTLTEFDVLEVLYTKGELPLKVLSEKMLMANGSITYVVNKLEKRKLIKRQPSKADGRVYLTRLTKKGYTFFDEVFTDFVSFNNDLFKELSIDEKKVYIEMTKRLGKSFQ